MAVRAKFRVNAIELFSEPRDSGRIKMSAVYGTTEKPENKEWSLYTPTGNLEMHITNPPAFKQFELGKEYYLDFTPAEEKA